MKHIKCLLLTLVFLCSSCEKEYLELGNSFLYTSGIIITVHDKDGNNLLDSSSDKFVGLPTSVYVNSNIIDVSETKWYGLDIISANHQFSPDPEFSDLYTVEKEAINLLPKQKAIFTGLELKDSKQNITLYWNDNTKDNIEFNATIKSAKDEDKYVFIQETALRPCYLNGKEVTVKRLTPDLKCKFYLIDIIK